MKNIPFLVILSLGVGLTGLVPAGLAMMGTSMMGGGSFGYGMSQGMPGPGNGDNWSGMMTPDFGGKPMGPGYGANRSPDYSRPFWNNRDRNIGKGTILTPKEALSVARNLLGRNPNLRLGRIQDKGPYFETEIRTKDNLLVTKLGIDKNTGHVRELY